MNDFVLLVVAHGFVILWTGAFAYGLNWEKR